MAQHDVRVPLPLVCRPRDFTWFSTDDELLSGTSNFDSSITKLDYVCSIMRPTGASQCGCSLDKWDQRVHVVRPRSMVLVDIL